MSQKKKDSKSKSKQRRSDRYEGKRDKKSNRVGQADSSKSKHQSNSKPSYANLEARTVLFDEKLKVLNEQIDLIRDKEELLVAKRNNKESDLNKNKNWPFSSYELCFLSKILKFTNLLLPTVLIRLECDGIIYGPFRALLDTGAQPNLISYTLFKKLRCNTSQTARRLLGVASRPFAIKRKMQVVVRPWFDSPVHTDESLYILPHEDTWKPLLPSKELEVQEKDIDFRRSLADPEYYKPMEVHILLDRQ